MNLPARVPQSRTYRAFDAVGCDLATRVRDLFTRFVAFHADFYSAEADTLTLWTLHTHAFDAAETTPYLLISAPTPEAGKSAILEVARCVVARPRLFAHLTPASLFRLIDLERPTLLIDEVDQLHKSAPLKAVLNAGYQLGGVVTRVERVGGVLSPVDFNVFGPKAFAGIGGARLPLEGATLARCVEIPMQRRKTDTEPVARFSRRIVAAECRDLCGELDAWSEASVMALLRERPTLPAELSDRHRDSWEPLAAIAALLGRDWPQRVNRAALALSQRAVKQPDPGTQIIADMRAVWERLDGSRAHTATLAHLRDRLEDRRYPGQLPAHELSTWLQRFGIHPLKNGFRIHGSKPRRGYERSAFADAFDRYL